MKRFASTKKTVSGCRHNEGLAGFYGKLICGLELVNPNINIIYGEIMEFQEHKIFNGIECYWLIFRDEDEGGYEVWISKKSGQIVRMNGGGLWGSYRIDFSDIGLPVEIEKPEISFWQQ